LAVDRFRSVGVLFNDKITLAGFSCAVQRYTARAGCHQPLDPTRRN
jgi:hypothetical protein